MAHDYAIQWLRLDAAAQQYGVSPRTVREWIKRGQLPAYRVGRLLMVRRDDLDAFARPVVDA